jgi:hypothetical protein
MEKRKLSFWQIWNMSFGFLGIQMGFALQNANAKFARLAITGFTGLNTGRAYGGLGTGTATILFSAEL